MKRSVLASTASLLLSSSAYAVPLGAAMPPANAPVDAQISRASDALPSLIAPSRDGSGATWQTVLRARWGDRRVRPASPWRLASQDVPVQETPSPAAMTNTFTVQLSPPSVVAPERPAQSAKAEVAPKSAPGVLPVAQPSAVMADAPAARVEEPRREVRRPAVLSSREKQRRLLAELDRDLMRQERRLNTAESHLAESRQQIAKFTSVLHRAMLEAGPDAKGLHPFVKVAQRYVGTPYVFGATSRTAFDCSGFIYIVMRDLGYNVSRTNAAGQFNMGMPVAQELLKPGDLVFFKNTYKPGISHVGIYLGRRRFIHAAGTGLGTIVSSLDASKYQAKYAGARRLVPARS